MCTHTRTHILQVLKEVNKAEFVVRLVPFGSWLETHRVNFCIYLSESKLNWSRLVDTPTAL